MTAANKDPHPTPDKPALHVASDNPSPRVPWLQTLDLPRALHGMDVAQLTRVAASVRADMINAVSQTGGHLGAGLGVVELTVALHATFNSPADKIIWDVGHQAYPHKILTGRGGAMHTIRQGGGLSGFTKRCESEHDPFGAGHSSTSISAGLGMAVARDLSGGNNHVICVIGDSAMTGGMAFEAMNNAGAMDSNLLVILNDNDMSIAPPTGALSKHLTRIVSSRPYLSAREAAKKLARHLPAPLQKAAARAEESVRAALGSGTLFEALGFYYIGPVDGHDLTQLLPILKNWRDGAHQGPVLLHVVTQKGKGYTPAENAPDKMHGVAKFCVVTGAQEKAKSNTPSYTSVFANTLTKLADDDARIVAVTAAMPTGTGLDIFARAHAEKCFDVGIAEQHAVTFAAGLAAEGYKPFCAIYSTFLQRAYDQIVHDVCIQNLPVRFAIDRAGLVGADGATHAGAFDVAYLGCLPNMVLMAPSDEAELAHMVATAAAYNDGPIAFRYPRGNGVGVEIPSAPAPLEIGKGRILRQGAGDVAILSYGTRLSAALQAADMLETHGLSVTVADARFAKPLDGALLRSLVRGHKALVTVEEGSGQGFGGLVLEHLTDAGLMDTAACKIRTLRLPDTYQDHDTQDKQYAQGGIDAAGIVTSVRNLLTK